MDSVEGYALRAFARAFDSECTEDMRAGLRKARAWADRMQVISRNATNVLRDLRRTAKSAERLAVEYHELCADRSEMGPAWAVAHFVDAWLTALPNDEPGSTTLAEWLAVGTDYLGPLRYAFPTSEWGFWKRALQQWSLFEGGVYIDADAPANAHASLRVLAGFRAPSKAGVVAADVWKAFVKQAKDHIAADRKREKGGDEFQRDLDAALLRGAARRREVREIRRRK